MKKIILCTIAVLTIAVACKKTTPTTTTPPATATDITPPVITLKGNAIDSISLGKSYTDAGATASDDKDGDLTSFIVLSGSVSTSITGTYTLGYIVRDAAGNSSAKVIRTVKVQNDADFLKGNYAVTCTCTTMNPGVSSNTVVTTNFNSAVTTSSISNNSFGITPLHENYISNFVTLNGFSINTLYQNAPPTLKNPVNGSGTLSANKKSFTLNSTENFFSYPNMSKSCVAVYTKQ